MKITDIVNKQPRVLLDEELREFPGATNIETTASGGVKITITQLAELSSDDWTTVIELDKADILKIVSYL